MTERQTKILTACVKLAAASGIQALTIKNISSEIGLSEAALYRHFQSKKEIMLGILDLFALVTKEEFELPAKAHTPSLETIKSILINRIDRFESFPEIAYIMLCFDIFMRDEELREAAIKTIHKHKDVMVSLLSKGQASGEIRKDSDPKELFRIVIGSFRLLLTQWFLNKYEFSLRDEFESLWKTIHSLLRVNS